MYKKTISALLSLMLVFGVICTGAATVGNRAFALDGRFSFTYPIVADYGQNHRMSIDRDGTMTLTGTGPVVKKPGSEFPQGVTNAAGYSIRFIDIVEKIVLSEGTTALGENAFNGYSRLKEVAFPSTMVNVWDYAFYGCAALEKLELNEGLKLLSIGAFQGCTSLRSVRLPESLERLDSECFAECQKLESVTFGSSLDFVGGSVFRGTAWLKNRPDGVLTVGPIALSFIGEFPENGHVDIPEGVKKLSSYLFSGCEKLKTVSLPSTLEDIGEGAFYQCYGLKDVVIPEGVKMIRRQAFMSCGALETIRIPSSVEWIGDTAFSWAGLREIRFSVGLKRIESGAFDSCKNLKRVVLPNGLAHIEDGLFRFCTSLEEVDLPDSLAEIPSSLFYSCPALKTVVFGKNVKEIPKWTFFECPAVEAVYLPSSLETVGDMAIPSVKDVYYEGDEAQWAKTGIGQWNFGDALIHYQSPFIRETRGDVDEDGKITAADARLALRRAVDLEAYAEGSAPFMACDADADGAVTAADARLLLRAAVGLEDPRLWA